MVKFGNNPDSITVTPAPKRRKTPKPTSFGGEPELSETPVIDDVQATAPVDKPDPIPKRTQEALDRGPTPAPKSWKPPKTLRPKKKKNKHSKKKRRHGR